MNEALEIAHTQPAVVEAIVVDISDGGSRASFRLAGSARSLAARVAVQGYSAAVGDRVVVCAGEADEAYVIGVLVSSRPAALVRLKDGVNASVDGDALVLRDADGSMLARYDAADGSLEISAPRGDLKLKSLAGRVSIDGAAGVDLSSAKSSVGVTEAGVRVKAPAVNLRAEQTEVRTERAGVEVGVFAGRGEKVSWVVERYELQARRLVERAQTAWRDVEGLLQTRAGRVRTLVKESLQMLAERTHIASKQDTSVDGKRVLLG